VCRRNAASSSATSSARSGAITKSFHGPVLRFGSGQALSKSGSGPPSNQVTHNLSHPSFGLGPGFCFRKSRPRSVDIFSTKDSEPKGRPVRVCRRNAASSSATSSAPVGAITKSFHGPVLRFGSGQAVSKSGSGPPDIREAALLHRQDSGSETNRARTGFRSTYRAAASRCSSSSGHDVNRPCQR